VGKTQLAAAFARECVKAQWRAVVWIVAERPGQIVSGLADLAHEAGVRAPLQNAELAAAAARRWLEALHEPSLLVFDNAADPDETARWLPRTGRTTVIVTSTLRSFSLLGTPVELDVFTEREAVDFLMERSGRDDSQGAAQVARILDLLPLALAQAAFVIRAQGLTFADYEERFVRNLRRASPRTWGALPAGRCDSAAARSRRCRAFNRGGPRARHRRPHGAAGTHGRRARRPAQCRPRRHRRYGPHAR
jgi:hypothetical protein